jgi:hypothetical protein
VSSLFSTLQVVQSGGSNEGIQQYRSLLDPSLQGQSLPPSQQPDTYDEELQGSASEGETLNAVLHTPAGIQLINQKLSILVI